MARRHVTLCVAALAAATGAVAASSGGAAAMKLPHPFKTAELFPVHLGASWTFAVHAPGAAAASETWSVTRRCAEDATLLRGATGMTLRVAPAGVWGASGTPWIADPVSAGKTWSPRPGLTVRITASYVDAKVAAGKYDGCAAVTRTEVDPDTRVGEQVVTTFCPAVGPVRIVTQPLAARAPDPPATLRELTAFAPGSAAARSADCAAAP
ncbi:MAG TPA: hypothetical protein VG389_19600 [Myxococcota bacterium]|nr:hypothetical protein [Myxococcota bacterium]